MCTRDHLARILSPPSGKVCGMMDLYYNSSKRFFVRFIPGSSASDVHYQGFLLEGLSRWNQERTLAALQQQDSQLRTFNLQLACKVD